MCTSDRWKLIEDPNEAFEIDAIELREAYEVDLKEACEIDDG